MTDHRPTRQAFRQFQYLTLPLHLSNEWLSGEYQRAAALIDAQMLQVVAQ